VQLGVGSLELPAARRLERRRREEVDRRGQVERRAARQLQRGELAHVPVAGRERHRRRVLELLGTDQHVVMRTIRLRLEGAGRHSNRAARPLAVGLERCSVAALHDPVSA
jgi:hypothetical protein